MTGNSATQTAQRFTEDGLEDVTLEAGFLWHKITRQNHKLGLQAEINNLGRNPDVKKGDKWSAYMGDNPWAKEELSELVQKI